MKERQHAVYLSKQYWQAVMACLLWHTNQRTLDGGPLWAVGKNRIMYIVGEIATSLPNEQSASTVGVQQK